MLLIQFLAFILGTRLVAASVPLCIQGCCNRSLQLSTNQVPLSHNDDTVTVDLASSEIPCCECSENSKEVSQSSEFVSLGQ